MARTCQPASRSCCWNQVNSVDQITFDLPKLFARGAWSSMSTRTVYLACVFKPVWNEQSRN